MVEKLDHEKIRKQIEDFQGKESKAWEELGQGNLSREAFRDLWLEIRVPTQKKPEAAKPVNPSKTPAKPPETP